MTTPGVQYYELGNKNILYWIRVYLFIINIVVSLYFIMKCVYKQCATLNVAAGGYY